MNHKEIRELIDYIASDFPMPTYHHLDKVIQRKIHRQLNNKHFKRKLAIEYIRKTLILWSNFGNYTSLQIN